MQAWKQKTCTCLGGIAFRVAALTLAGLAVAGFALASLALTLADSCARNRIIQTKCLLGESGSDPWSI